MSANVFANVCVNASFNCQNRQSGVDLIKQSITEIGWDNALGKLIVMPLSQDYAKFLQCFGEAKKAYQSKCADSEHDQEEKGGATLVTVLK